MVHLIVTPGEEFDYEGKLLFSRSKAIKITVDLIIIELPELP